LRILCDSPWNGGYGLSPREVSQLTLDQVCFLLCDRDILKGGDRIKKVSVEESIFYLRKSKDGKFLGRSYDGSVIEAEIGGESLVSRLRKEGRKRRKRQA